VARAGLVDSARQAGLSLVEVEALALGLAGEGRGDERVGTLGLVMLRHPASRDAALRRLVLLALLLALLGLAVLLLVGLSAVLSVLLLLLLELVRLELVVPASKGCANGSLLLDSELLLHE
jgi:hypothetical protein